MQLWLAKVFRLHLCRFQSSQLCLTASSAGSYAVHITFLVKQSMLAVHWSTGIWGKVIECNSSCELTGENSLGIVPGNFMAHLASCILPFSFSSTVFSWSRLLFARFLSPLTDHLDVIHTSSPLSLTTWLFMGYVVDRWHIHVVGISGFWNENYANYHYKPSKHSTFNCLKIKIIFLMKSTIEIE